MKSVNGIYFVLFLVIKLTVQEYRYCPEPWIPYVDKCYHFSFSPLSTYDEAKTLCGKDGATLVSVNDKEEHTFISNWLINNDVGPNQWYTSGIVYNMANGQLEWKGDGTPIKDSNLYWLNSQAQNQPGLHIVYTYGVVDYKWTRVAESSQLAFICEINVQNAYKITKTPRDFDYGTSHLDPSLAPQGPQFFLQARSTFVVDRMKTVSLEWIASANPSPTFKITRTRESNTTSELSPTERYTITNGKITIENPEVGVDEGVYQCIVENRFGRVLGDTAYMYFGNLGEFSNIEREPVVVNTHEQAIIPCRPPNYKPAVSYQWWRDARNTFVFPQLTPYIFVSRNGNLYFSVVGKEDSDNYRCVVTLTTVNGAALGTNQPPSRTSMPIALIINTRVESTWGPQISNDFISVFPTRPLRGQSVYLECLAFGTMPIDYAWERPDLPMPPNHRLEDHGRVLIIEDVQLEDGGDYKCKASRGFSYRDEKTRTLVIEAKPFFSYPLQHQHVDIGSQVTMRCEAKAIPAPVYAWYVNGTLLSSSTAEFSINKNVLVIRNADAQKHNGMYQCSATNTHGTSFTEAQLRVLAFAPTFDKSPLEKNTYGALGGNVTIRCQPEVAPFPEFTWQKNGIELGLNHGDTMSRIRMLQNGYLFIQGLTLSDAGIFTCTATNVYGKDSSSSTLSVGTRTTINVGPTTQTLQVNMTAFLTCAVSAPTNTEYIYRWKLNGYRLDLENNAHFALGTGTQQGLYVRNAQLTHTGTYECQVVTPFDLDSRQATITVQGPPLSPAGVFADTGSITQNSLLLKWTVPENTKPPIIYYFIEGKTELGDVWTRLVDYIIESDTLIPNDDKRAYKVTGLKPGVSYSFRVFAGNIHGVSPPSLPSVFYRTQNSHPVSPPKNVGGGGGTVGVLTITWTPQEEEDWGGMSVVYDVFWRKTGNTEWVQVTMPNPTDSMYVKVVGEEYYYQSYEVKVRSRNYLGPSPNSTVAQIYSAEGMPIAVVTNVQAYRYNATAVMVTWDPLKNVRETVKGVLMGYQVNYIEKDTPNAILNSISWRTEIPEGLVIGLLPNTWYTFDVQILTTAGMGPMSVVVHQRTHNDAPLSYPTEVHVHSDGSDSVRVTWRGLSTGNGEEPLQGYIVRYWLNGEDIRTARNVMVERVDSAIIHGIEKDYLYNLRVLGYSRGGEGKLSKGVYFTLGGRVSVDPSLSEVLAGQDGTRLSLLVIITSLAISIRIKHHFSL